MIIWKKKPEDLAEVLPKEILPVNYGGTERPLEELRGKLFFHLFINFYFVII